MLFEDRFICTGGCLGRQFIQCLLSDLRQLHGEAAAMLIVLLALLCHLLVVLPTTWHERFMT